MSHLLKSAALAAMLIIPAGEAAAQNWGGGRQDQQRGAPRGSYAQSCSDAYVNQGRLYADCRTRNGQRRSSSIELNRCTNSDIGNDDGLLVCHNVRGRWEDRGGNNGGGWGNGGGNNGGGWGGGGGNGRNSITVYRDGDFRGASAVLRGEEANLSNIGMNDAISSMEFRGAWEVCTDAYFRGQCQVFDSSVRDLGRYGLNDRISSLRPARRGGGW